MISIVTKSKIVVLGAKSSECVTSSVNDVPNSSCPRIHELIGDEYSTCYTTSDPLNLHAPAVPI